MIQGFDELNIFPGTKDVKKSQNRSIPYKEYFNIMKLSKKQKKERVDFAERLEDDLILIMLLFEELKRYNITDDTFIVEQLKTAYLANVESFNVPSDGYISDIALAFAVGFVKATLDHLDDEWYTSSDRLKYNAENEANTVLNYKDYLDAKERYKYKTWHTENDNRVRMTHVPLEGERIPIDDLFVVGDALMRYPKDIEYCDDMEEIVNCRCSIEYSN